MKKLNKKGFTLVELLAVIVVLAVIMIIAVPSVLDSMNSARKSAFIVYGDKMINAAQAKYQSDQLVGLGLGDEICYSLTELTDSDTGGMYTGYVIVTHIDKVTNEKSEKALYYITMTDKNFSVSNRSYAELDGIKNGTLKTGSGSDETIVTLSEAVSGGYTVDGTNKICDGYTKVEGKSWYSKTAS